MIPTPNSFTDINDWISQLEFDNIISLLYYSRANATNLEKIHAKLGPTCSSELTTIKTREDRTLFFDFMQVKTGKIKSYGANNKEFALAIEQLIINCCKKD